MDQRQDSMKNLPVSFEFKYKSLQHEHTTMTNQLMFSLEEANSRIFTLESNLKNMSEKYSEQLNQLLLENKVIKQCLVEKQNRLLFFETANQELHQELSLKEKQRVGVQEDLQKELQIYQKKINQLKSSLDQTITENNKMKQNLSLSFNEMMILENKVQELSSQLQRCCQEKIKLKQELSILFQREKYEKLVNQKLNKEVFSSREMLAEMEQKLRYQYIRFQNTENQLIRKEEQINDFNRRRIGRSSGKIPFQNIENNPLRSIPSYYEPTSHSMGHYPQWIKKTYVPIPEVKKMNENITKRCRNIIHP